MGLIEEMKKSILRKEVEQIQIPELAQSPKIRKHFVISGHVQNVGLRYEVTLLAERLGLTGWIKNMSDGTVAAELQGGTEKLSFFIQALKSLSRIKIENIEETTIPGKTYESRFRILY